MSQISIIKKSDVQEARRFDAEFFKPKYLEDEQKIISHQWDLLKNLYSFNARYKQPKYDDLSKIKVINSQYLRDDKIDYENARSGNNKLVPFEAVMINSTGVGTLGRVNINYLENVNISVDSHVNIIVPRDINSYYLTIFLQSKYGKNQIIKNISGSSGQIEIYPRDFDKFKIPILPQSFQLQIEKIVQSAYQKQTQSKQLYKEAEEALLKELDLLNYKSEHILSFETTKKETDEAGRFDAEYFQPKYEEIIKKIEKYKNAWDYVGNIVHRKKGVEVGSEAYQQNGMSFGRVADCSRSGIEKTGKKISKELYQELKKDYQPKQNDILFTKDGTIGLSYVVKEEFEVILSGAFLRLSIKDKYQTFEKECLSLIFNSIISKMQVEKLSGGAIIAHL